MKYDNYAFTPLTIQKDNSTEKAKHVIMVLIDVYFDYDYIIINEMSSFITVLIYGCHSSS